MMPGIVASSSLAGGAPIVRPVIELDFINGIYKLNDETSSLGVMLSGDVDVDASGLSFDNGVSWTPCMFTDATLAALNASSSWTILIDFDGDVTDFYPIAFTTFEHETYGTLDIGFYLQPQFSNLQVYIWHGMDFEGYENLNTTISATVRQVLVARVGTNNPGIAYNAIDVTSWTTVTEPPVYQWGDVTLGGFKEETNPSMTGHIRRVIIWGEPFVNSELLSLSSLA